MRLFGPLGQSQQTEVNKYANIKFIIGLGEIAMISSMEITLTSKERLTFATALLVLPSIPT